MSDREAFEKWWSDPSTNRRLTDMSADRAFYIWQAAQAQAGERKCSECGNGEPDLSLYCVRCLNNDHWHLIDPAQAPDPVAVADKGVINWIDGKQFDHAADLYTQPAVNQQAIDIIQDCIAMGYLVETVDSSPTHRALVKKARAAIAAAQEQALLSAGKEEIE